MPLSLTVKSYLFQFMVNSVVVIGTRVTQLFIQSSISSAYDYLFVDQLENKASTSLPQYNTSFCVNISSCPANTEETEPNTKPTDHLILEITTDLVMAWTLFKFTSKLADCGTRASTLCVLTTAMLTVANSIVPKVSYQAAKSLGQLSLFLGYDIENTLTEQIIYSGLNIGTAIVTNNFVLSLSSAAEIEKIDKAVGKKTIILMRSESKIWQDANGISHPEISYEKKVDQSFSFAKDLAKSFKGYFYKDQPPSILNSKAQDSFSSDSSPISPMNSPLKKTSFSNSLKSFTLLGRPQEIDEMTVNSNQNTITKIIYGANNLFILLGYLIVTPLSPIMPALLMHKLPEHTIARSLYVSTAILTSTSAVKSISDLFYFLSIQYHAAEQAEQKSKILLESLVPCLSKDNIISEEEKLLIKNCTEKYLKSFGCLEFYANKVAIGAKFNRAYCSDQYSNTTYMEFFVKKTDKILGSNIEKPLREELIIDQGFFVLEEQDSNFCKNIKEMCSIYI